MPRLDDTDDIDALIDRAVDTFFVEAPGEGEFILELEQQEQSPSQQTTPATKSSGERDQGPSLDDAVDSLFMGAFQESKVPDPTVPAVPTSLITSGDEEIDRAIDLAVDTLFVEDPGTTPPETTQIEVKSAEIPTGEQAFRDFVAKQEREEVKAPQPPFPAVPAPDKPKGNYDEILAQEIERRIAGTYQQSSQVRPPKSPPLPQYSPHPGIKGRVPLSQGPAPKASSSVLRPTAKTPVTPEKLEGKRPVAPHPGKPLTGPLASPPVKQPSPSAPSKPLAPKVSSVSQQAKDLVVPGSHPKVPREPSKKPQDISSMRPSTETLNKKTVSDSRLGITGKEKPLVSSQPQLPPLRKLQEAILTLEWEISDRSLLVLSNELNRIRVRFRDDMTVDFAAVAMKLVVEYISKRMSRAHPESVRFLLEVADFLEVNLASSEEDPLSGFHHILTRYEAFKATVRSAEGIEDRVPPEGEELGIEDPFAFSHMVVAQTKLLAKAAQSLAEGLSKSDDPKNLIRSFRFLVNRSVNRILEGTRQPKTKVKAKEIVPKKRRPISPAM